MRLRLLLAGALVGLVPASLMGIIAGAVYGPVLEFAISSTGLLAGAVAAFWLGRTAFQAPLKRWLARDPRLLQDR